MRMVTRRTMMSRSLLYSATGLIEKEGGVIGRL